MDQQPRDDRNELLLIAGVVVLVIGLALLGQSLGIVPPIALRLLRTAVRATGPLAIILLGVIVIIVASRGGVRPSMPAAGVKLYRSRTDRKVSGVAAGLAAYFGLDPLIVRLGFVLLGLASFGTAVVLYVILAVLMPEEPGGAPTDA